MHVRFHFWELLAGRQFHVVKQLPVSGKLHDVGSLLAILNSEQRGEKVQTCMWWTSFRQAGSFTLSSSFRDVGSSTRCAAFRKLGMSCTSDVSVKPSAIIAGRSIIGSNASNAPADMSAPHYSRFICSILFGVFMIILKPDKFNINIPKTVSTIYCTRPSRHPIKTHAASDGGTARPLQMCRFPRKRNLLTGQSPQHLLWPAEWYG